MKKDVCCFVFGVEYNKMVEELRNEWKNSFLCCNKDFSLIGVVANEESNVSVWNKTRGN